MARMGETIDLESEADFIEFTETRLGTFRQIEPSEKVIMNLSDVQWDICKWPHAEGTVNIGSLQLKKTHHRCMTIWYN